MLARSLQKKDSCCSSGCGRSCKKCFKCLSTVSKLPCCCFRLVVTIMVLTVLIFVLVGYFYGLDYSEMYHTAKNYASPYIDYYKKGIEDSNNNNNNQTLSPEPKVADDYR